MNLATITDGNQDFAELLWLVAFILAAIGFVLEAISGKAIGRLLAWGWATAVALAFFVL